MYPELHLGPLTIQTFGLCFALAFLAAGALVWKRFGELGYDARLTKQISTQFEHRLGDLSA